MPALGVADRVDARTADEEPGGEATRADDRDGPTGGRGRGLSSRAARAFLCWGAGGYLVVLVAVLVATLRSTGGRLIYVLDDPAIHLSVAENLARHGTWGVVPGHFESASSSPLWTVLLAAWDLGVPAPTNLAPLVLNVVAALAVVALLARHQQVLHPGRQRPLDIAAVVALVAVVLFLPGLTLVGMEHTLHAALVLAATILVHGRSSARGHGPVGPAAPSWLALLLVGLATLTRFETAFVVAGIGLASVLLGRAWGAAVRVGLACALPLAGFALANRLGGQGFLPNSVLAKTGGDDSATQSFLEEVTGRFTRDPLIAVLTAVLLAALLVAWQARSGAPASAGSANGNGDGGDAGAGSDGGGDPSSAAGEARTGAPAGLAGGAVAGARPGPWPGWAFPALVYLVAVVLHVTLARVGWYERNQAYLVVLGVYALLSLLGDVVPRLPAATAARGAGRRHPVLVPGLVGIALLFTATKLLLTTDVGEAASETYQQRYQAGLFLERYYDGEAVATGELGYISLFHDGPVTDLFGLGDHEVLQERLRSDHQPSPDYWARLGESRGFDVVAAYPSTLWFDTPADWILVGTWRIDPAVVTAWEPDFQFWATSPAAVDPLARHLQEFGDELPAGVTWELNPYAELQAAEAAEAAEAAVADRPA